MVKAKIPPTCHEIYAAVGRRTGQRRKVVAIVAYIPPHYNSQQNKSFYDAVNDSLMGLKTKYNNPYMIVGGDFNRQDIYEATREYPEIKTVTTGPTRGNAILDLIATDFNDQLLDAGTTDLIYNQNEVKTDHKTVFSCHRMPRVPSYDIEEYSYYHITQQGDKEFGRWLNKQDWSEVFKEDGASKKNRPACTGCS